MEVQPLLHLISMLYAIACQKTSNLSKCQQSFNRVQTTTQDEMMVLISSQLHWVRISLHMSLLFLLRTMRLSSEPSIYSYDKACGSALLLSAQVRYWLLSLQCGRVGVACTGSTFNLAVAMWQSSCLVHCRHCHAWSASFWVLFICRSFPSLLARWSG